MNASRVDRASRAGSLIVHSGVESLDDITVLPCLRVESAGGQGEDEKDCNGFELAAPETHVDTTELRLRFEVCSE